MWKVIVISSMICVCCFWISRVIREAAEDRDTISTLYFNPCFLFAYLSKTYLFTVMFCFISLDPLLFLLFSCIINMWCMCVSQSAMFLREWTWCQNCSVVVLLPWTFDYPADVMYYYQKSHNCSVSLNLRTILLTLWICGQIWQPGIGWKILASKLQALTYLHACHPKKYTSWNFWEARINNTLCIDN
jgi:hypothetical protein